MTRNSSESCWSSDDSSFGWVDMEDTEPAAARKASAAEERTSDSDDESSDDSDTTQFDPESKKTTVPNVDRQQKQGVKGNHRESTKISGRQVVDTSDDSDSTQFDAGLDNTALREEAVRSKGKDALTVKEDQHKALVTVNASRHEPSEDSVCSDSANESSDGSDKKYLKPFTKGLLVKKESANHSLSDDSNIDSPPLRHSVRLKTESGSSQPKSKDDRATLIEGVLLDSAQPLPFDIDANEDVWIVQCPYEVSESTLKGKTLNFSGVSCAEQFEGRVLLTAKSKPVNLLQPKSPLKLKSLMPAGHIIFKKKETSPHALHPVCNEDNITSLPKGLKERHPLFGTDLSLVQRLYSPLQKTKKKKKKKKQNVSDLDDNEVMEENSAEFSNSLDASSMHNKKKKKKSKILDEPTVAFSRDSGIKNYNIDLSSFHLGGSLKMPSEKNRNDFIIKDCVQSELQHKKIKHEPWETVSQEITNPELAPVTPSKKRKRKHLEFSFESEGKVAGGTSDEAENMSQKKKKRKYGHENNTLYDVYSNNERTVDPSESYAENSDQISRKKKKHHKNERDFESENILPVNNKSDKLDVADEAMTLDPVRDGLLHTAKKKKKKKKIEENYNEFMVTSNSETNADMSLSTKKKKKVKMENSDEHLGQLWSDARDTKNNVCSVSGEDLDYFGVDRKKLHKEEKRKFRETGYSPEFSEENSPHSKLSKHTFDTTLLKQESSYQDYSLLTDVHHKKKKKRKSE